MGHQSLALLPAMAWPEGMEPRVGWLDNSQQPPALFPPLPSRPSLPRNSLSMSTFCPEVDPRSPHWGMTSGSQRAGARDRRGLPSLQEPGWDRL